jgi:hypothetical protein
MCPKGFRLTWADVDQLPNYKSVPGANQHAGGFLSLKDDFSKHAAFLSGGQDQLGRTNVGPAF